ncbi:MAG: HEAT repeat domain-containing protein [Verrucomicrobiota bacterium]|jgi:HEAT repeat protein
MKLPDRIQRLNECTRRLHDRHGQKRSRAYLQSNLSSAILGTAITDKISKTRRTAIHLLHYWDKTNALRLLAQVLASDPASDVRHEAAFVLLTSNSPKAVQLLKSAIARDSSTLVQHEAIEALGDLVGQKAKRFLARYRKSADPLIRATVAMVLDE